MSRSHFALATFFFALLMAYASTFIGVAGPHFVPIDPSDALDRLIHVPYVENGSDQRSDWMGNLLMAVPLGFLMTGWLAPRALWATIWAFAACFVYIVAIKYVQLFFPPRTVTLNYIIAQSLGAAAGVLLFVVTRRKLKQARTDIGGLESLRLALWVYTAALILFLLMPLDFALSMDDLLAVLDRLPDSFTTISGEGRPLIVRAVVIVGGIMAMMPLGAALTIVRRGRIYIGRTTGDATWIGLCAMTVLYAATCLLLSGTPSLAAIVFRTAGIALGAWLMHWLARQDPVRLRHRLGRLVPWMVPIYLVTVFAANGLLSFEWTSPSGAARSFYIYGLIPLYNYYIVTKPQAAKNLIGHAIMYAPIGVMIWFRAQQEGSRVAAFVLAALLSSVVEAGRFLRPGLVPDINAIPLAGVAASVAVAAMPMLWRMLSAIAIPSPLPLPLRPAVNAIGTPVVGWRHVTRGPHERGTHERETGERGSHERGTVIGDVEEY